jgi:urease accessory protein
MTQAGMRLLGVASVTLFAWSTAAAAHGGTGLAGGFLTGFMHPLSGLDHMLAMVAVGLWGAFLGRPLIVALPMLFPLGMVVGGALGMMSAPMPPVEIGIAASVLVLGLMILLAVRAPVAIACTVVGVFALFHGYAHGQELPSAADPVGYSAGFVVSTGLLHLAGIALGTLKSLPAGVVALRAGGGAIALGGLWFLFAAVAP